MLYLIGLGLNENGISWEGLSAISRCRKTYLDGYTVDFPYSVKELEGFIGIKFEILNRKEVESSRLIDEAKKENIALLVYGSPLFATTHETLLTDAKKAKVKTKIIYAASVFDAVASSGLQLYKFGKIASMPKWQKNFNPTSFMGVVKQNQSIKAHSLILCDVGLGFGESLSELKTAADGKKIKLDKIMVCSRLGTENTVIIYDNLDNLKKKEKKILPPFCLIIPSELHFVEKEALEKI